MFRSWLVLGLHTASNLLPSSSQGSQPADGPADPSIPYTFPCPSLPIHDARILTFLSAFNPQPPALHYNGLGPTQVSKFELQVPGHLGFQYRNLAPNQIHPPNLISVHVAS